MSASGSDLATDGPVCPHFGSDCWANLGTCVRIRIGHGRFLGPIYVRIGIEPLTAYSRVLLLSPRLMGTGTLNHLFKSNTNSSRDAIKADLAGKILYDDPTVFARLRVDEHATCFVTNCAESLKADFADEIALLKELVETASKRLPDKLEQEEKVDAMTDRDTETRSGNHGSVEEKKMYLPLVRIFLNYAFFLVLNIVSQLKLFNHITQFGQPNALRKFERTNGMLKADDSDHLLGFPSVSPDITISLEGVDAANSKKWRHRDAFGEVKPSNKQGPMSVNAGTIPPIVAQCADYARLFMSARPFMLFCVGILIFGTDFCVGIFDRDGVTFSPVYDMFKDTDVFVRVVRSLACELSIEELGLDPTIRVLSDEETKTLTNQPAKNIYPSALVSCGGTQWCTIGTPIWSSLSFLGRGTHVWCVRQCVQDNNLRLVGDVMIMKTAWRSSARTPESDIYLAIPDPYPEGVAKFKCGGDVNFPSTGFPITMQNLRNKDRQNISPATLTPVLHRLILLTVGRPMWEYVSERDLLTGFRDAIRGQCFVIDWRLLSSDIVFQHIRPSAIWASFTATSAQAMSY